MAVLLYKIKGGKVYNFTPKEIMSKIRGVHHIALLTTIEKYDATVDFYNNVLGLSTVRSWGEGANRGIMISCGDNTVLEIMSKDIQMPTEDGVFAHIALETDAVDELVKTVRDAGYEVTMEPTDVTISSEPPYPIRVAFFRGPMNEHVEFFKVY